MSKVPGGIKSAMKTTFTAGKSLLSNPKVLRTLGRVASVGLRVGRMATPIGWASLAAEGAIRLGYHAYKSIRHQKRMKEHQGVEKARVRITLMFIHKPLPQEWLRQPVLLMQ
ncbi:hypothetical protein [Pragia fontium]|uniref:hypothetical protein n=1 Tax=Pragia fontium TaxID=82985 RepID=UPI0011C07CEE|nr:hypothetical protein [Pragia fontium]